MSQRPTLILGSGGLRSLVATAVVISQGEKPRPTLLHLRDGRANAAVRLEHARRQADYFKLTHPIEVELPHLQVDQSFNAAPASSGESGVASAAGVGGGWLPLVRPQVLMVAMAQAMELKAVRLVWPVQFNGDYHAIARITEQVILVTQLAQLEHPEVPVIETPLLELTDRQLIELGAQLKAPWHMAWSCQLAGEKPCRVCTGCRRRRRAFDLVGINDATDRGEALVAKVRG